MPEEGAVREILVVDCPGPDADAACEILRGADYEVHFAVSAEEAIALVPSNAYAAAVVACGLAGGHGVACIRELQRRDRDLPCIVVADMPTIESVIEAANLCIHGYLVRPLRAEDLLEMVGRAAEHRRLGLALREERLRTAQLLGMLQTIETIQDRINNPLQVILGYAELLGSALGPDDEEGRQFVQRISEAGSAIADVVAKLRHVRRPLTKKWSFGETLDLDAAQIIHHERREHRRVISVMLARIRGRTGRRWHYVDDLSRGGLAIHVTDADDIPEQIEIELADPDSGETYECRAERVWMDPHQSRAGLRFTEVDPGLIDHLRPEEEPA